MPRKTQFNRIESKTMHKITDKLVLVNPLEAAKAAMPFFGGENTEVTDTNESTDTGDSTTTTILLSLAVMLLLILK